MDVGLADALADGTHGQLGPEPEAEPADQDDIQRCVELLGDFEPASSSAWRNSRLAEEVEAFLAGRLVRHLIVTR